MLKTMWRSLACVVVGSVALIATNTAVAQEAVKKEDLRYGGKPFSYWQTYCRTELKAELRIDALRAMGTFGARGYGEDATRVILEIVKDYPRLWKNPDDYETASDKYTLDQWVVEEARLALVKIGTPAVSVLLDCQKKTNETTYTFSRSVIFKCRYSLPLSESHIATLVKMTIGTSRDDKDFAYSVLDTLPDDSRRFVLAALKEKETVEKVTSAALESGNRSLLTLLKPHAKVVVPILVVRMKELNQIRAKEIEKEARSFVPFTLGTMPSAPGRMPNPSYIPLPGSKSVTDSQQILGLTPVTKIDPQEAKAQLKVYLEKTNSDASWEWGRLISILAEFGPMAEEVLPVLQEAMADPNLELKQAATEAIREIARQP